MKRAEGNPQPSPLTAREWAQKETASGREWDGEDAADQFKCALEDKVWCLELRGEFSTEDDKTKTQVGEGEA